MVENKLRNARAAVRTHGGEVYFDFTAGGRVVGEYEGVGIRMLETVTWEVDVSAPGSGKIYSVVNESKSPKQVLPQGYQLPSPPLELRKPR